MKLKSYLKDDTADSINENHHKNYVLHLCKSFLIIIILGGGIIYPLVVLNFFKLPYSLYWVEGAYKKKEQIALSIDKPKIVFAAGSSAHFSIRTRDIEAAIGRPCVNFGVMALLGLDYLLYRVKKVLRSGDTVVLPLEYDHFLTPYNQSPDLQRAYYILSFDHKFFKNELNINEKIKTIFKITPWDLLNSIPDQIKSKLGARGGGYQVETINDNGDEAKNQGQIIKVASPLSFSIEPSIKASKGLKILADFKIWCETHGVRLLVAFGNTINFKEYRSGKNLIYFSKLEKFMSDHNIETLGTPFDGMYDITYFYDSAHHMNEEGMTLRTKRLIELLQRKLKLKV